MRGARLKPSRSSPLAGSLRFPSQSLPRCRAIERQFLDRAHAIGRQREAASDERTDHVERGAQCEEYRSRNVAGSTRTVRTLQTRVDVLALSDRRRVDQMKCTA